jgi:hypothetical protein
MNYVNISAFRPCTTFGIDMDRIMVIKSGTYKGCIEVHLANYEHGARTTQSGGAGLALSGQVAAISDHARDVIGRFALVAGADEVFRVRSHYDSVVILESTEVGLGVRWHEFIRRLDWVSERRRLFWSDDPDTRRARAHLRRDSQRRIVEAVGHLVAMRQRIAELTGCTGRTYSPLAGPYVLRHVWSGGEQTSPVFGNTIGRAAFEGLVAVSSAAHDGFRCGEEGSLHGEIQPMSDNTVAWLCKKDGVEQRISVEFGGTAK